MGVPHLFGRAGHVEDTNRRTLHALDADADRHLWGHFSALGRSVDGMPIIERGEGCYVWDNHGKRYLDGLAGLYTTQVGYGRTELAQAAFDQMQTLGFFPIWTYAHPKAVQLAKRLSDLSPGNLNRVFFTSGGSEAVESAFKLARQYFKMRDEPDRIKVISRNLSYHGTTMGALSITGLDYAKTPARLRQDAVPAAGPRRPEGRQHPGLQSHVRRRPRSARHRRGERDRTVHHRQRSVDDRRRVPRAGAERRRLSGSAGRLLHSGP